jgi:hypothetical protein
VTASGFLQELPKVLQTTLKVGDDQNTLLYES